jgi:LuxR family maltose regulon positive regulatory protein
MTTSVATAEIAGIASSTELDDASAAALRTFVTPEGQARASDELMPLPDGRRRRPSNRAAPERSAWGYALVEIHPDGSFGRSRLLADSTVTDGTGAIRQAMADGDWSRVATALVESHAVLRILAGTAGDEIVFATGIDAVGGAEPLLRAALAVTRGDVAATEAALDRLRADDDVLAGSSHQLAVSLTRLALARLRGDWAAGIGHAARTRDLMIRLPIAQLDRLPELPSLVDAHLGSLQLTSGNLQEAARTLARGAGRTAGRRGGLARADCQGQLALLEAFRGDLRKATQHADDVLGDAADPRVPGVMHARLAKAWVALDRDELEPARRYLDCAGGVGENHEPWLMTTRLLAEARLLTAVAQPETALRLLADDAGSGLAPDGSTWLSDHLAIATAETLIAAGEPQRALARLTPVPAHAPVESAVVAAVARREIGDARGARATLATVVSELVGAPLRHQIQSWMLEARLLHNQGDAARARLLVGRVLRVAESEGLRRPLALDGRWLRGYVDRDADLLRDHRDFLASFTPVHPPPPRRGVGVGVDSSLPVVVPLTEREDEVLTLLAQMFSTDEIAGALYISGNTVKTHVKGIFDKFGVRSRVKAVRRGRELGLC